VKVRDLIEILEQCPMDAPVTINGLDYGQEVTEVVTREETYFSEDCYYEDGEVVKIY